MKRILRPEASSIKNWQRQSTFELGNQNCKDTPQETNDLEMPACLRFSSSFSSVLGNTLSPAHTNLFHLLMRNCFVYIRELIVPIAMFTQSMLIFRLLIKCKRAIYLCCPVILRRSTSCFQCTPFWKGITRTVSNVLCQNWKGLPCR